MKVSDILSALKPICDAYKSSGVIHKYKAYKSAMDNVKAKFGEDGEISSVNDIDGIKGVGTAMKEKIAELLKTGKLQQTENVKTDPILQALDLFTSVHGIGPVLANKLVREQHLRTIEDLRRPEVYSGLPALVHLGLKHYEDTKEKIPFDEVEEIVEQVSKIVAKNVDPRLRAVCCGSHRRMVPLSGDVDILLTHPFSHSSQQYSYLPRTIRALKEDGIVLDDSLADGVSKFMGFAKLPDNNNNNNNNTNRHKVRRIDIRWMPADHFFAALMYFTGSAQFNIRCRVAANEKGFTLNEMGLWKASSGARREREDDDQQHQSSNQTSPSKQQQQTAKELVLVPKCEADLFAALGIEYLQPKDRTH